MSNYPIKMYSQDETTYFVGKYQYSLDSKNRVSLPAKYRRMLPREADETFVITKGAERCLHLYPRNYWHQFVHRYWDVFFSNQVEYRRFALWCYRDTHEMQLDRQGRIQLPKELIEYALLNKEVAIIGYNTRIEFWNHQVLERFIGEDDEKFMNMAVEFTSVNPMQTPPPPHQSPPNPYQPPNMSVPHSIPPSSHPGQMIMRHNHPQYPPGYYQPYYPPGYYPQQQYYPQPPPEYNPANPSGPSAMPPGFPSFPPAPTDENNPKGGKT